MCSWPGREESWNWPAVSSAACGVSVHRGGGVREVGWSGGEKGETGLGRLALALLCIGVGVLGHYMTGNCGAMGIFRSYETCMAVVG